MRDVTYVDSIGRKFLSRIPDDSKDSDAQYGIIVGPPLLDGIGLPVQLEISLHNELFNRGIFTLNDAKRRRSEIVSALSRVLAVDANKVMEAYQNG